MKKTTVEVWFSNRSTGYVVHGYHAFDMHGYSFVVHRKVGMGSTPDTYKLRTDCWVVTEKSCGGAVIGEGHGTREEAVAEAKGRLERKPPEELSTTIHQHIINRAKHMLGA